MRNAAKSTASDVKTAKVVRTALLAFLSVIGFDFFLHAGVLASLYAAPSPFLLSSDKSFRLIPLGYLSFLILVGLLTWLMLKLNLAGWKAGTIFGLKVGALIWGALTIGLFSVSTASPVLLLGWFSGQTIELGIAGMVLGSGLETSRLRSLSVKVIIFVFIMVVLSIIFQNT